ncbi:MAG: hypothetical protein PHF49_03800 [Patescibacteria group bacterium]|nr:hypothetical protein [Patescibacteria group bacterium]NCC82410.1 hypothetical protein [Clostridia bacterium]
MNNKNLKVLIFSVFLIIILAVFYLLAQMSTKDVENNDIKEEEKSGQVQPPVLEDDDDLINNEEENDNEAPLNTEEAERGEAINLDENGVDMREAASLEAQAREMPFPGIEGMGLEFMSEEEKLAVELPVDTIVQIVARDFSGNISAYKIIYRPEDIIYPN